MRRNSRSGIALLTAIWLLTVLLLLASGFAVMVHSGSAVARNFGSVTQARWAAQTGLRHAEAELLTTSDAPFTAQGGAVLALTSGADGAPGQMGYDVVVEDEAGRINLNTAPPEVLAAFFPVEAVDAIIDWRDADGTPGASGAEDDYYTTLQPPYHCKNAPFDTVGELGLVRGVTPDLLDTAITDDGRTLRSLLTVWSWDANTDAEGQPRVNIASASRNALTSEFGDTLTPDEIDAIVAQRSNAPFAGPADLLRVPELSRDKVMEIYDRLTTSGDETRQGLVNVNTAPWEVLAVLPGMDEDIARAVVAYREAQGPLTSVGDLLAIDQVTPPAFMGAANLLTTRSSVFHIASTGEADDGLTDEISEVVQTESDGSETIARVLYRRE